jgi:hypothetical protein
MADTGLHDRLAAFRLNRMHGLLHINEIYNQHIYPTQHPAMNA